MDTPALPELRWSLPHGVRVAYSTASDGDQRLADRREAFVRPLIGARRCIVPRQIHGVLVADAGAPDLGAADGVATRDAACALGAYGADCPGVVIAAPDALAIGHCGWRGTAGGMVGNLVAAVAARTASPRDAWCAFIGPGISGPRYEVDAPVLQARPWPEAAVVPSRPGHAHLDLPSALAADLAAAGIPWVQSADRCTAEDPRLHSFRHQGSGLVQLLLAWRE